MSAEVICTVTYIQASKLCRALKKKCAREQGEMALGKNKPCCYFCDINLPCILQSPQVVNCSLLCHELEIIIVKVKTARWRAI